jgi:peptidoglycan/xylan/chitin deacetylase (PgdA/CDA1 family)
LKWSGLARLLQRTSRWSGVLGLNYHRIGTAGRSLFDHALWSADAETLTDHVRFLKLHLDVIGPGDLRDARRRGRGRYGLITFDDGYRDNYEVAFEVLRAERAVATFFVTTGFIDGRRVPWWDEIAWMVRTSQRTRIELTGWLPAPIELAKIGAEPTVRSLLRAFKRLPPDRHPDYLDALAAATGSGRCEIDATDLWMTWEMLRVMRAAGMAVGGHTVTHPILASAPEATQRAEIVECGRRLAHELGEPMRYFSYPVGGRKAFNDVTRTCLREAGVECAFSYYGGFRSFDEWDDYDVRRVGVETDVTAESFRAIVSLPRLFA